MKTRFLKLIIILFVIIILSFIFLIFLNKKVSPLYMEYAESEMERVVTTVINKSVSECSISDNLFLMKKDYDNTVIVDYDPVVLNKIIGEISNRVSNDLKLIGKKDFDTLKKYDLDISTFYIPSGIIFHSIFLNNLGPKIPIFMEPISSINPNIETKVTEYGINNSLIEVNIKVVVNIKMILPTSSKNNKIMVIVPLTVKIIQGNIPEYYFGSLNKKNN